MNTVLLQQNEQELGEIVQQWARSKGILEDGEQLCIALSAKIMPVIVTVDPVVVKEFQPSEELDKLLSSPIQILGLSVRPANVFVNVDCTVIGHIARKTEQNLLRYRNFGKKGLDEVRSKLKKLGVELGLSCPMGPRERKIFLDTPLHVFGESIDSALGRDFDEFPTWHDRYIIRQAINREMMGHPNLGMTFRMLQKAGPEGIVRCVHQHIVSNYQFLGWGKGSNYAIGRSRTGSTIPCSVANPFTISVAYSRPHLMKSAQRILAHLGLS